MTDNQALQDRGNHSIPPGWMVLFVLVIVYAAAVTVRLKKALDYFRPTLEAE